MASTNPQDRPKERVAQYALKFVDGHRIIGLGHGSTTNCFIRELAQLPNAASRFLCPCVSSATISLAQEVGLTVVPNGDVERIELYVDGADEATPRKTMLKGGGGALLRERIAASMSAFRVNLIDHGKLHDELGSYPLAVEISSEGTAIVTANIDKTLRDMGFVIEHSQVRRTPDGTRFLTDNGYPIYDVKIGTIKDPTALGSALKRILGVLDHGIFVGLSDVLCVVKEDGDVFEIR